MKNHIFLSAVVVFLLTAGPAAVRSQFTPEERERMTAIEDVLLKGEILRSEKVGIGVTNPTRIYLRGGGMEISGIWKDPGRGDPGFGEGWRHEIAAYRLNGLLGLGMIPPTVERRIGMRKGSLQYWVDGLTTQRSLTSEGRQVPEDGQGHCDRMQRLANTFDSLIANIDRTQENVAYTPDWRMVLLDHSRSFRTHGFYVEQLVFGDKGMRRKPLIPLPREFVDRLSRLDAKTIREAVAKYLNAKEIQAVLKRRDLILAEIDDLIRQHGEDAVLYD